MLTLSHEVCDQTLRLCLNGELTLDTVPLLDSALQALPAGTRRVVLDGTGLEFVDSTGVGALLQFVLRQKQDGVALAVTNLRPEVHEVLDILGLLEILTA